jgi:hypothetical protein
LVDVDVYDDGRGVPLPPTLLLAYDAEPMLPAGVGGGSPVSTSASDARSSLLPTSRSERLGDASARASLRNGCSELNDRCDVTS